MSQYTTATTAGSLPPSVATSYVEDTGAAVPVGNVLNILSDTTDANVDDGIFTRGTGNTVFVLLTNRITSAVTTNDATPTPLITFALGATPGVLIFEGNIVAYDTTDVAGGAYTCISAFRTTGAAAVEISTEFQDQFEENAMAPADFAISANGNNFVLTVTGIAAKTINWNALLTYRFVS
jgi:hypothetical protein